MDTYEKKYKEALEKLRSLHDDYDTISTLIEIKEELEYIFPELKESEDERIRKEIMDFIDTKTIESDERRNRWFSYFEKYKPISFISLEDTKVKMSLMQYISELNQDVVHLHPGIETCNEWLAWLEKQGELKSSKWAEGDVVRHGGILALVTNGRKAMKSNREQITIQYPDEWVKAETKERKYFFDELEKQGKNLSCGMDVVPPEPSTSTVVTGSKGKQGERKPTDKCVGCNNVKGCVTCVDGSEWAHISEQKPQRIISAEAKEALYDKPSWSKEDENVAEDIEEAIRNYWHGDTLDILLDWLKSLKQRVQPKQEWCVDDNHEHFSELLGNDSSDNIDDYAYQCAYCMSHDWIKDTATWDDVETACKLGAKWNEKHRKSAWSEEDEEMMSSTVFYLNEFKEVYQEGAQSCISWLKSLKDRVQPIHEYSNTEKQEMFLRAQRPHFWRPSDEQVKALKYVAYHLMPDSNYRKEMFSLYEDLKKLTE